MNCPTCGLDNPSEVLKCDCGFDFSTSTPSVTPGWEIDPNWGQKLSAFWSVSWPAWIGSWLLVMLAIGLASNSFLGDHRSGIAIGIALARQILFFGFQAILSRRLFTKNYQTFLVHVIRDDGHQSRKLSYREGASVWLWMLVPQLAIVLLPTLNVVMWFGWWGTKPPALTSVVLNVIFPLLHLFVVGPYAVGIALRAQYRAFRLQAHGFRY
jgi:hypothetical protein